MNLITKELLQSEKFKDYLNNIEIKKGPVILSGLTDVGATQFVIATKEVTDKPICIITYNELQAKKLLENIKSFSKDVVYFPKKEILTYDYIAESKDLPYERIEALIKLQNIEKPILITTIEAIMQKMISKEVLFKNVISLKVGDILNIDDFKQTLVKLGYVRYDLIDGKGQFSSRGGIIDISLTEKLGIRIEFWGDDVDSIRYFDIATQRSTQMIEQIDIYPMHEYLLECSIDDVCKKILKRSFTNKQLENVNEDIELIKNGDFVSKVEKYFNCFYSNKSNILEYISQDSLIFFDEIGKIRARAENIGQDNLNIQKALVEKERIIPDGILNIGNIDELDKVFKNANIYLEKNDFNIKVQGENYNFNFREVNYYKSNIEEFFEDLRTAKLNNKKIYILLDTEEKAKKISDILMKQEIVNKVDLDFEASDINDNIITIGVKKISTGFELYDLKLLVISANELIDVEKKRKKVHSSFKQGEKIIFEELKIGDYVVHKTHGIGQFIGVNTIKADGVTKDYIKIRYKNDDILYVPTDQLDNIRKYIGSGDEKPKINRLGSKEWSNTKNRVKNNLREVARELIELYAKRQKIKGYSFSKDTVWQQEFENNFPYQETEDQIRCIDEVKKDMESPRPMDRLLCGDVGYGKTEVAIRAAFKAVMDQKQVAYLVPTTVLANQQYESFKERMELFPIRVEVLNRFRTKKEQEEIIRKLKLGEIDVIIGTHRLLSKDVQFKDLGLLIIDEEHRFGVKDKEKIKEYKTNIDVLTMTATPIPRTLHMSIVGIRDMSVIYEPPQNRKPVQTYVLEYDREVIKEAITKEIERKGQVFYLFNNVERIEGKANEISDLVPEANIAYAHGKMTGTELENIMMEFVNGNIDVLVCTTILESGIDIPNANTIIVENADRLGLAQLYQIRGRVGRSDIQSYAYITYKRDKLLSEVADKRLKAIKEFTEFGSGFKIAMRDLEIRGAGSLLGEIQHGHLEQVGYDTYCKLLDEVIKEMQGIEIEEENDVQIDLNISTYIPDNYIEDASQKIKIYQDIALCRTEEDIQNVIDTIIDIYGDMPKQIENLIEIVRIKELCKRNNILKVMQKANGIVFYFDAKKFRMEVVDVLLERYKNKIKFSPGNEPYITYKIEAANDNKMLDDIKEFLEILP